MTTPSNNEIQIILSKNEALVFFDWLCKFNQQTEAIQFEDQAEQRVLWNLEARLEKVLVEPFDPNYKTIIAHAREEIRDKE